MMSKLWNSGRPGKARRRTFRSSFLSVLRQGHPWRRPGTVPMIRPLKFSSPMPSDARERPYPAWPRRCWRDENGVAALEFAFVVPVLVILLAGIIQLGGIMFTQNNMGDVARETARNLVVGELTATDAQQFAEDHLLSWSGNFTVTVTEPDPNDPNDNDVMVEIEIPMADVALIDILGIFQTGNLRAVTTMRKE